MLYFLSASMTSRSLSEIPGGSGAPPSAGTTSGGTVAGRLMWMPSNPAATLRNVARVSKALHELGPGTRDVLDVPARAGRPAGEAVARNRGNDDVERVFGAATMRGRIGERTDDLELLDDRSRPAMRDDHRQRVLMAGTDVDEMDVDSVDRRDELGKGVQLRLQLSPVVVLAPVANQLLELPELSALRAVGDGFLVGPARRLNAPAEIDECLLRNVDPKRSNCVVFRCCMRVWQQTRSNCGRGGCEKSAPGIVERHADCRWPAKQLRIALDG